MTDPHEQIQNHTRGTAVVALAELLRQPPGELREFAMLSVLDHVRNSVGEVGLGQIYLTAKAVAEEIGPNVNLPVGGLGTAPLLTECQEILSGFYPEFKTGPMVGQMVALLRTMTQPDGPREITASDVFGVQATTRGE